MCICVCVLCSVTRYVEVLTFVYHYYMDPIFNVDKEGVATSSSTVSGDLGSPDPFHDCGLHVRSDRDGVLPAHCRPPTSPALL